MPESWEKYRAEAVRELKACHWIEAEAYLFAALQTAELFGEGDRRLTVSLESLAEFYWNQKKYLQAEVLCRRLLTKYENALGKDHIDVAILANNLAMLCHLQKKYIEAEGLYNRTISIKSRILGAEHPDVVKVLENYANLLMATHRAEEAEHLKVCAQHINKGQWSRSGTWRAFHAEENQLTEVARVSPLSNSPAEANVGRRAGPIDEIDDEVEFRVSEL